MEEEMAMPPFYDLVRKVAQVGAVLGCLAGVAMVIGGIGAFKFGFMAGVSGVFGGVVTVVLALASLGVSYCFLALVKAQIDTRNAVVYHTLFREDK